MIQVDKFEWDKNSVKKKLTQWRISTDWVIPLKSVCIRRIVPTYCSQIVQPSRVLHQDNVAKTRTKSKTLMLVRNVKMFLFILFTVYNVSNPPVWS